MARISGSIPDDGRVIIINESDRVVEYSAEHLTGNYDAEGLTEGAKIVLFRRDDGFTEGYSNVDTVESLATSNVFSFGYNNYGQLGLGDLIDRSLPTSVGISTDWKKVSCGADHTLAIKDDGTLWGWGRNSSGQLGIGSYSAGSSTPIQIGENSDWLSVACGSSFTLALKNDGTMWSCGQNTNGQLGQNDITTLSMLTKVGTDTNWANVYCGTSHVMAIKSTGTSWSWGYNQYGQLGFNDRIHRSVPTQIGSDTNWVRGDCCSLYTIMIKSTGTAWACGRNTDGVLGLGNNVHKSTFTQIGSDTNWYSVALGDLHTIMLKKNNTIWSCGQNFEYQLGMGDMTARSVPTQIGSDTDWSKVDSGEYHVIALKRGGTAWCWAASSSGQLGLGNTDYVSTPTRIGTEESWLNVSCGSYFSTLAKEHAFIENAVGFSNTDSRLLSSAFNSNADKVVIAYQDYSDSMKGKAVVGTVLGDTITFGSAVTFNNATTTDISAVFDPNANRVVISYTDFGEFKAKTIIGTVSNDTISFGSAVVLNDTFSSYIASTFESSTNKVIITYRDSNDSNKGKVKVGTVSGTSISFGTAAVFSNTQAYHTSLAFDSNTNKVVVCYTDQGDSNKGKMKVGTISGDTISFGSAVTFNNAGTYYVSLKFDPNTNKIVSAYKDSGNNNGKCIVGTVSGDTISLGTPVVFNNSNIDYISAVLDSNTNKIAISYKDYADNKGKYIVGVVLGDSISFSAPIIFSDTNTAHISAVFDSNSDKVVISYAATADSNKGKTVLGITDVIIA